jgi:hypothetical protein
MANFQLPIEKFLVQKVQEYFPSFDLREGTAFRDMMIKPMIIFMQPYRDQTNVIKRNLSLQNFEIMRDEEMNALVSNLFVNRRGGVKAEGTIRVYMTAASQVSFSTETQFQTSTGLIFSPKETISFTAEELALNIDGLYFYSDVPCIAEKEGNEYNIDAHAIVFISGGPTGVSKVDNLGSFAKGVNIEDNATLQERAKTSIAVRDLVTKRSISSVMLENFNTLKEVAVIGFGDSEMARDVVTAVMDLLVTVDERTTGEITGTGSTFEDNNVDNPINFIELGIQPGHRIVILNGLNAGKHTIKAILNETTLELFDYLTVRVGVVYGVDGFIVRDDYHIGGKVDVYVDTTKLEEDTFYLDPAAEVNSLPSTLVNLPVVGIKSLLGVNPATHEPLLPEADYTLWPEHTRMTEDLDTGSITGSGITLEDNNFNFTTANIRPAFSLVILEGLNAGSHMIQSVVNDHKITIYDVLTSRTNVKYRIEANDYRLETTDPNTRLSASEKVQIRLLQNNPLNPDRYFIGNTLGSVYYTDTSISEYQAFVGNDQNRVVTTDIMIRRCLPTFIDLHIDYKGTITEVDIINVIREFIDGKKIGSTLSASDLISMLYFFNVEYVSNDFIMYAYKYNVDGTVTVEESTLEISSARTSKYIPRTITVTKLV